MPFGQMNDPQFQSPITIDQNCRKHIRERQI